MVNKNKKKLGLLLVTTVTSILAVAVIGFKPDLAGMFGSADGDKYTVELGSSNGAAILTSLKTNFVTAKTKLGNDVKMVYKNCEVTASKIAKIKRNGFYGNAEPINGGASIAIVSNAVAGDATVRYGLTSACLDGQFDLATGNADGLTFNYFKIVAKKEVTVESIDIELSCDNSNDGFVASYGSTDNRNSYEFVYNSYGGYDLRVKSASSAHYLNKLVVPDYYNGSSGYKPVNRLMNTGAYGFFECAKEVKEVYLPENIIEFGSYVWSPSGGHNQINKITYPRDLAKASTSGYLVPKSSSLQTIVYKCKNLTYSGSYAISSSSQTALKEIYVSYDVEKLPNSFISSLPSGVTLYYEGTTAEWASLTASAANWKLPSTTICSDTEVKTVTLKYANSTLNGDDSGEKELLYVSTALQDPGTPVWTGTGNKIFDGWYTALEGGEKVTFPYTPTADITLHARFIDMPAGYAVTDPVDIVKGNYDVTTRSDLGFAEYFKYTATVDETVAFEIGNPVSSQSTSGAINVFNTDGSEVNIGSASYSAEESVKKIANLTNHSSHSLVKIRFAAGESYIIAVSSYNYTTGYYGTNTLKVYDVASLNGDHTSPKAYTVGENEVFSDPKDNLPLWYSFSVTESGSYTVNFNNSDKYAQYSLGYFNDGVWTELAKSNYSATTKIVSLTAGVTYFVCARSNGVAGNYGFKVFKGAPEGFSADNPITLPVDGTEVNNSSSVSYWNYFKVVITEAGAYKLTCSENVGSSATAPSYTDTTYNQDVQLSASQDMSNPIAGARVLTDGSSAKSIVYDLAIGTYYLKATVYSSARKFSMSKIANAEGLTVESAKAITLTSGTAIDTSDAGVDGKLYKFTVASEDFHVFTADTSATVKLGKLSTNGTISYFNSYYSMSNGDLHKKLTVDDTYYLYVKDATSVNFTLTSTIEDGESRDTAYSYTIGTEEKTVSNSGRIKSSTTYFKFTLAESAGLVVTRGSTNTYYFKIYKGDNVVAADSTNYYKAYYSLTAGDYIVEAYSYSFKIETLEPGTVKGNAITKTLEAEDTSITLNAANGSDGTWYKFTAPVAGFYQFVTTTEDTSLALYVNDGSLAGTATTTAAAIKAALNDVVYMNLVGEEGEDIEFAITHPASVQNGRTMDTAFEYVNDDGQVYMSRTGITIAANSDGTSYGWTYIKVNVTANTEYVFYSISTGIDLDTASTSVVNTVIYDENQTAMSFNYSDWDVGSSDGDSDASITKIQTLTGSTNSSDFYTRFNSGSNTTVYLRYKLKDGDHKIAVRTLADFKGA